MITIDAASPATVLRVELQRLRAQGCPWTEAWHLAMAVALSNVPTGGKVSQRGEWQRAFRSTRPAWEEAYHHKRDPALWSRVLRDEDADPSERPDALLVA